VRKNPDPELRLKIFRANWCAMPTAATFESFETELNRLAESFGRRTGSFDYYISEPVVNNDLKGIGPFILAGIEVQRLK
jgi:rhamnogalacturonyl hydrolase YesR